VTGISIGTVVLDCADPVALASFYQGVLGGEVSQDGDGWVDLAVGEHRLSFQKVDDHQPPTWPDGHPQQFHLDLTVEEYDGPHALVTSLGATPLDPVEPPPSQGARTWRVYADPAGHPFCLCTC
jgi:catechol-2,3-dioxygenase